MQEVNRQTERCGIYCPQTRGHIFVIDTTKSVPDWFQGRIMKDSYFEVYKVQLDANGDECTDRQVVWTTLDSFWADYYTDMWTETRAEENKVYRVETIIRKLV